MPSIVTPKVHDDTTLYSKRYNKFRGVDFSTDPTQVNDARSPLCQNLISDLAGFPEKRTGWRTLHTIEAPVNGIFHVVFASGASMFLAHGGDKLYKWADNTGPVQIYGSMNNARSVAFAHKGKLYILDGAHYLVCTEAGGTVTVSPVTGFIPTTVIGAPAAGGGTPFEAVNLISSSRINSMVGDGTSTVFHLDGQNIEAVDSVKVEGAEKTVGADYTVDSVAGTVTFSTAPPAYSGGAGVDNVVIRFRKIVAGYADKINKCTIAVFYGLNNDNRIFMSGNPDEQNVDWQSGLDDPTYFPDTGYTKIGADTSAIMGYLKQYNTLSVIKNDNEQDAQVFLRTAEMQGDGTVIFPVQQGIKGIGAVSKYAFGTLRDDPLFFAREGVFALASTAVTQERVVQDRSFFVNAKLCKEDNLETAVSVVWEGYYLLCINGRCYVADGRQKSGATSTEQYGYEWYFWTNIPARVFLENSGSLYFGTEDGRICRFSNDMNTVSRFGDDDSPIVARWATKADEFGTFMRRKTLTKKGCGVMIKPYTRSSIKVYIATEAERERLIKSATMDIFDFGDIDFSRFTFNAFDAPQVVALNTKVKKFITLQLIFENDVLREGFGVYGAQVQYAIGNYVK